MTCPCQAWCERRRKNNPARKLQGYFLESSAGADCMSYLYSVVSSMLLFHCHHESSEAAQPESSLMGVASKSKKTWQHGVVYIRYPVSNLTALPVSLSWCFCEFFSACLFFLCLYVGFATVFTLPIFHSHVHKCFPLFSISLSLTLTQTNTQIFVFSHTLFLWLVAVRMQADVDWLFLQMINSS